MPGASFAWVACGALAGAAAGVGADGLDGKWIASTIAGREMDLHELAGGARNVGT
jgi:hypothetical protein